MRWKAADALKQQVPLLDYLQAQHWQPSRQISGGRLMGLCPLHADRRPSFLVNPSKNLFYCYQPVAEVPVFRRGLKLGEIAL